jgi:ribonuclease HI
MEYTIYTDGSAFGMNDGKGATKDTPAGWGFVVVEGPTGPNHNEGTVVEEQSGRVITDSNHPLWIGADIGSNNTGELSAIYYALEWAKENATTVTIYSDSNYALNMTFGNWKPSTNKEMIQVIRLFAEQVANVVTIEHSHIRAHSGFKWNEVADRLADQGARS